MEFEDPDIINEFVVESSEHLSDIENQLLTIEASGADIDVDLINTVFRGVHSIKGAAGFIGLTTTNKLAHALENVLNLMRESELVPTSAIVNVMLQSADQLQSLIDDVAASNDVDVSDLVSQLDAIAAGQFQSASDESTQEAVESSDEDPLAVAERLIAQMEAAGTTHVGGLTEQQPAAPMVPAEKPPVATAPSAITKPAATPAKPTPAGEGSAAKAAAPNATKSSAESNIRVSVESLDHLMNLAGELVLGRNQLLQTITSDDQASLEGVAAKINQVTCEMQDAIMQTRMQPIGNVFTRFNRVVRDLSAKLDKKCQLVIEGKEVEVDKTIVEAISDPLTHLVRNAVDHGMETPNARESKGKPAEGTLLLRAFHQSGKVCIEIKDDGAGINAEIVKAKAVEKGVITTDQAAEMSDIEAYRLILMPGFSTAEQVSDVSGRGVGMDVVRTNIEKLGGTIDIDSTLNAGTIIQVTLPLTLAIIPSLIVHTSNNRFAIPQVNIVELVRVRSSEVDARIGKVKDAEVLRLRGSLLPLVRLGTALDLASADSECDKAPVDRALNIIVVETGQQRYGLIVDGLFDSEEIVVKPLGRHLKECRCLSGATILGDGRVALILDVSGISQHISLGATSDLASRADTENKEESVLSDNQSLLLLNNSEEEQFAIPMEVVSRIERIRSSQLRKVGDQLLLQYPDSSLPLICLEDCINAQPRKSTDKLFVVVTDVNDKEVGFVTPILHDIRNISAVVDDSTLREPGVMGSIVIDEVSTRLLDVHELIAKTHPDWLRAKPEPPVENEEVRVHHILLAEDSKFFRKQVKKHIVASGYTVTECEDGQEAWETVLADPGKFDLIVTDIQMPRMNGFEFCDNVKHDARTMHLPVIALTSLAGEEDIKRGLQCGVDDYQLKMDPEKLFSAIRRLLEAADNNPPSRSAANSTAAAPAMAMA